MKSNLIQIGLDWRNEKMFERKIVIQLTDYLNVTHSNNNRITSVPNPLRSIMASVIATSTP